MPVCTFRLPPPAELGLHYEGGAHHFSFTTAMRHEKLNLIWHSSSGASGCLSINIAIRGTAMSFDAFDKHTIMCLNYTVERMQEESKVDMFILQRPECRLRSKQFIYQISHLSGW